MPGDEKGLNDDECQGKPQYAEYLEIHPGFGIKIIGDIDIDESDDDKKYCPADIEPMPDRGGQCNGTGHHALNDGFFTDEMTAQEYHREQPVQNRRFPLDEYLILQYQCGTTEDHDNTQRYQVHGFESAVFKPVNSYLYKRRGYSDGGCNEDAINLECNKEQEYREKIK